MLPITLLLLCMGSTKSEHIDVTLCCIAFAPISISQNASLQDAHLTYLPTHDIDTLSTVDIRNIGPQKLGYLSNEAHHPSDT